MQKESKRNFRQALEKYLERPLSWAIISASKRLDREFGDLSLDKITPAMVCTFRDERLKVAKASTVSREIFIIKHTFKLAVNEWQWLDKNPIIGVSSPKISNSRTRWVGPDEEDLLVRACPPWLGVLVKMDIQTGLRLGEIVNLKWEDVHCDENYILITKNKENRPKAIPLSPVARAVLELIPRKIGYIFLDEFGKQITVNRLEYEFRKATQRAGIKDLSWHCLRHSFASRLAQRGVSLYQIQTLMGHRSATTTARYAHLNTNQLQGIFKNSV
jgi:integrase